MELDRASLQRTFSSQPGLAERFEILSVLGDGAAGFVYKVRDRSRNNEVVALKVLANDLAFDEATFERFVQELRICQKLRHPNLVEAYDLIPLGDTMAFTMEFVDGGSLQGIFAERKIGHEAIDKILEQVLDALSALHEQGVVHRDIKLENILVRTDGVVKVTDLGLMKQAGQKALTKSGILLGTPQYMPPEYVRESTYDERGDIYTTGLMLYELLSGKRWLSHLRGQEVITHLVKTKFEVSRASLAGVPAKYLTVLARALEKDPTRRYQSAAQMKRGLLGIPEPESTRAAEPTIQGRLDMRSINPSKPGNPSTPGKEQGRGFGDTFGATGPARRSRRSRGINLWVITGACLALGIVAGLALQLLSH